MATKELLKCLQNGQMRKHGGTHKGPLSAVDSLVVLQGGQLLEGPTANTAGVRLLVRVVEHVFVVGLLEGECLAAH